MYTNEEKAIKLVIKAFEGKKRQKEDINLAVHSITVGHMLNDIGCREEVVISGFLHDIIEDTSYDYEYLKENFGKTIADNVLMVTEDMEIKDWVERKKDFIERFQTAATDILLIELADKLHNLIFDYEIYLKNGKDSLATTYASYEMNKWYYSEMKILFNSRLAADNKLLKRYNDICKIYFEI